MDDETRDLRSERIELDEQWTFVGKKQRRRADTDDESRMGVWATSGGRAAEQRLVWTF